MKFSEWSPLYTRVISLLKLDKKKDEEISTNYLSFIQTFKEKGYDNLVEEILSIKPKRVWVLGAGPSLENDFNNFKKEIRSEDIIVAADGSSSFLLQQDVVPKFIFSDLDGSIHALNELGKKGSILVIHAHGDNFHLIQQHFLELSQYFILPTVQTEGQEPFTYNFGGFTDGDRAISALLDWFPSIQILLLGFTFGSIQGRYSKNLKHHIKASEFKLKKLEFAKEFLAYLAKKHPNQIYNFSQPTDMIHGVKNEFK